MTQTEAKIIKEHIDQLRALHVKESDTQEVNGTWITYDYCQECENFGGEDWPCPTILMLDNYEGLISLVASIRPSVLEFAEDMEAKLKKHDGDRSGWNIDLGREDAKGILDLLYSLGEHETKLHKFIFQNSYRGKTLLINSPELLDKIISSSADVANFAMMIADNARRWKESLTKEDTANGESNDVPSE